MEGTVPKVREPALLPNQPRPPDPPLDTEPPAPAQDESAVAVHGAPVPAASRKRTPRLDWAGLLQRTFALTSFGAPAAGASAGCGRT